MKISFKLLGGLFICANAFAASTPIPAKPNEVNFDWASIENHLHAKLEDAVKSGQTPIFDIESSYGKNPHMKKKEFNWLDCILFGSRDLVANGVAAISLSPDNNTDYLSAFDSLPIANWGAANHIVFEKRKRIIGILPVPIAGNPDPPNDKKFRQRLFDEVLRDHYPLMGEFFFRHYPSPIQNRDKALRAKSDFNVPIDGKAGDEIFAFSAKNKIPFEIHYEIEDRLLKPLEKMLKKYPDATVIWSHFARVRKPTLARAFDVKYVKRLLLRYPNLYFDLGAVFPSTYRAHFFTLLWDKKTGNLKPEWKDIIEKNPWRFLAALDLGGDRFSKDFIVESTALQRKILGELSPETASIVGYRAAWKVIFKEGFAAGL